jgi:transketolase
MPAAKLDELCINTIRFLAVDAVEKANSGHPGMPLGAAAIAYTLWDRYLKHNPADPSWADRDRFVLSSGHASAMLYALLHLTGYALTLDEVKNFRQWGSLTPGHIEYGLTPGVETTTGPLGQGFANGVGMALAERNLAARYNQPGHEIVSHYTYAIVSDGDLEEGITAEAASFAAAHRLGNLIYLYDKNDISIEGDTAITFTEDVAARFRAYGWHTVGPVDGFNVEEISAAIEESQKETDRPSLIVCRTTIGYGAPHKQGTAGAHGEPLGTEEARLTKENLGWEYPEPFTVPPEAAAHFRESLGRGDAAQKDWQRRFDAYAAAYSDLANQFRNEIRGVLPDGWDADLDTLFAADDKPMATREASGLALNHIAARVPALLGGSADLAPSNKTHLKDGGDFGPADYAGRNLHFGVREHSMGAIAAGMTLHGGCLPYVSTFLVFYDYMRPSVRLAALMGIRVIYVYTHDSIGVGEDGPTHQPVEQVMGLRSVPGLVTFRPADARETAVAWRAAVARADGPTALALTRQKLPALELSRAIGDASRGGYVLWQASPEYEISLLATGSEVSLALEAAKELETRGVSARVVSLPSWEVFADQPADYRDKILPAGRGPRISIEAGITLGWQRFTGLDGLNIGIDRYGASAPAGIVFEKLGLTAARVVADALTLLGRA